MKKISLLLLLVSLTFTSFAKINWVYDMQTAKAMALGKNKLIVIDFWATWCGPCKKMESEFWGTDKVNDLNEKLVFLKADVDVETRLSSKYSVRGIPYIVVVDIAGNKIWDVVGYSSGSTLKKVLGGLPTDVAEINKAEVPFLTGDEKEADFINVGKSYAEIGKDISNKTLKKKFIGLSNYYFKKIRKGEFAGEAELRLILNRAYLGQTKKLVKKVMGIPETEKNKELRNSILSYIQNAKK